jgi:hypothetical protein
MLERIITLLELLAALLPVELEMRPEELTPVEVE